MSKMPTTRLTEPYELPRILYATEVFKDSGLWQLFTHCYTTAQRSATYVGTGEKRFELRPGELMGNVRNIAFCLNVSKSCVEGRIKKIVSEGFLRREKRQGKAILILTIPDD